MRTGSLLNCFDLSAGQWQLSMIRSGQLLLVKHDFQNATMTHSKLNSCMVVLLSLKSNQRPKKNKKKVPFKLCLSSLYDNSKPLHWSLLWNCWRGCSPEAFSGAAAAAARVRVTCCAPCCREASKLHFSIEPNERWQERASRTTSHLSSSPFVIFFISEFESFQVCPPGTVGCCRTRGGKQHVTHRCFTFAVRGFENLTCQDRHVPPPRWAAYTAQF